MQRLSDANLEEIHRLDDINSTGTRNVRCSACEDLLTEALSIETKGYCLDCFKEIEFGIVPRINSPLRGFGGIGPQGEAPEDNPLYDKCKKSYLNDF
ncbi:hypothetical protein ACFL2S_05740 [Thermodesulfobacteriota bacterium]